MEIKLKLTEFGRIALKRLAIEKMERGKAEEIHLSQKLLKLKWGSKTRTVG